VYMEITKNSSSQRQQHKQWRIYGGGGGGPGSLDSPSSEFSFLYCFSQKFKNTKNINIQYNEKFDGPTRKNSKIRRRTQIKYYNVGICFLQPTRCGVNVLKYNMLVLLRMFFTAENFPGWTEPYFRLTCRPLLWCTV